VEGVDPAMLNVAPLVPPGVGIGALEDANSTGVPTKWKVC